MRRRVAAASPVTAAVEDESDFAFDVEDPDSMQDTLDDATDAIEDLQETVDQVDDAPRDTVLDTENNIQDHYIAECCRCHEIFISAVVESDSPIESIEGECPCCHEQTKQELKWIVRDVNYGKQE